MQRILQFPADNPWVSGALWLVVAITLLYIARRPARRLIRVAGLNLAHGTARAGVHLQRTRRRLIRTHRRNLMAYARERTELQAWREIGHLEHTIQRDLAGLPHLQRVLSDHVQRLEADYQRSVEAPPPPPEWMQAVESVARLERGADPSVARVLEDMHGTLERACHETLQSYRSASLRRHRIFQRIVPVWRRMNRGLETIEASLGRIERRAAIVQHRIGHFQNVAVMGRERARRVAGLVFVRWLGALFALAASAIAAFSLHGLITRPMAEIGAGLGTGPAGAPFTAWLSLSLIGTTVAGGLLMSEAVGVTRLIPGLAHARTAVRTGIGVVAGILVLGFALAAAGLAAIRDYLLALDTAAAALFNAGTGDLIQPLFLWVPALSQAALAFGLALLVALAPLPLETTIRQGSLALGSVGLTLLAVAEAAGRWLASAVTLATRLVLAIYDILVCVPLFVERTLRRRRRMAGDTEPTA